MEVTRNADEVAAMADHIYEMKIRPSVEPEHIGEVLVLDVESGDYEIDRDEDLAIDRIEKRRPRGMYYIMRIGYPASVFVGTSI